MAIPVAIPPLPIQGDLTVPAGALGLVIFAHGSGSSRFSLRNQFVASQLHKAKLGTLLIDLLSGAEDEQQDYRFDIELLANRLLQATAWAQATPSVQRLPIGYFGASTGAAAALMAAAEPTSPAYAVVSRGGRPDLAGNTLALVRAPALLLVGSLDEAVLAFNARALRQLNRQSELQIVDGATHLFEEPGTLGEVARKAGQWFLRHLPNRAGNHDELSKNTKHWGP